MKIFKVKKCLYFDIMDVIHDIYLLLKNTALFISNDSLIKILYDITPKIITLEALMPYEKILYTIKGIKNVFKNCFELNNYVFEIIPIQEVQSVITIKNMKYDVFENIFINKKEEIETTHNDIHDIVDNTYSILEIIELVCLGIDINETLKNVIFNNVEYIILEFKRKSVSHVILEYLYKIQNIETFKYLLRGEYSWVFKLIMFVDYDKNVFDKVNIQNTTEMFLIMLIQHRKYDEPFKNKMKKEKLKNKLDGIEHLNNLKNTMSLFNKAMDEYKFKKKDSIRIKQLYYIFEILNSPVKESLKIGFIFKNYYLFNDDNIAFCIKFYGDVNNKNINLYYVESAVSYINEQSENIPKYKKNKHFTIIDYQNCYILFYQSIYEHSNVDYDKVFSKAIKQYAKFKKEIKNITIFDTMEELNELNDNDNDNDNIFNDLILH